MTRTQAIAMLMGVSAWAMPPAAPPARAAQSPPAAAHAPLVLTLATATPGGGFPLFGDAFAAAVHEADPDLEIRTRNTAGSTENIPLLDRGDVDLALVQGEAAHEAAAGDGRPAVRLPIVSVMYATPGFAAVRRDSPVRSLRDLRGRRVALGARGSGLVLLGRYVLRGMGIDPDRDITPILLDRAGDGPAMVRGGRVDALWGGGAGWPGFVDLLAGPGGARLIAPAAADIPPIVAAYPFLTPLTLPAGSYADQREPLRSVGSWSLILARRTLPDETAYRVARALHSAEAGLARRLPQGRDTTAANTAAIAPRAGTLHPGVARYLRDIGLLVGPAGPGAIPPAGRGPG
jgi:TRAP transporter TAXI family solute receptor